MLSIIKLRILGLRDEYIVFLIMTVMALGLTSVFGASMNVYKPTIAIIDEDESQYSHLLIEEIQGNTQFNYEFYDYEKSEDLIEEGKVLTGLRIRKGFEENILKDVEPIIDIIKVRETTDTIIFEGIIGDATRKMTGNAKISNITSNYIYDINRSLDLNKLKDKAYKSAVDNWKYRKPIRVTGQLIGSSDKTGNDSLKHSIIGFSIFFSMYTIVFGIGTILNDKQYNTWQRMMISPLSKVDILGGSLIVTFIIGSIQLGVLILAGRYLFNIHWGQSISGILLIAGTFVFAVTSLGLFLSGMVKTHSQLAAISPVILTSTAMLGGCMWPLEIVNSKILLILANFTPQKWAVEGMEKIATYGHGFEAAILPSLILILMGLIFFGMGVKLLRFE